MIVMQAELPDEDKRCRRCCCDHGLPVHVCDKCKQGRTTCPDEEEMSNYCGCNGCGEVSCHGDAGEACGNKLSNKLNDLQIALPDVDKRCRRCCCEHGLPVHVCRECKPSTGSHRIEPMESELAPTGDQRVDGGQAGRESWEECTLAITQLFSGLTHVLREVSELRRSQDELDERWSWMSRWGSTWWQWSGSTWHDEVRDSTWPWRQWEGNVGKVDDYCCPQQGHASPWWQWR